MAEDLGSSGIPSPARELMGDFTNPERRRPLRDEKGDARKQALKRLRAVVDNPDLLITTIRARSNIHPRTERAIRLICQTDSALCRQYSRVPEYIRGPLAFLLQMLCMADEAHEASEKKSAEFDRAANVADDATNNGASAENIGSHSLLAKDSPGKIPLYEPAMNLATRVATYIAEVMVRQVERRRMAAARFATDAPRLEGSGKPTNTLAEIPLVDWLHLLQHFLCHPDEAEERWYVEAMRDRKAPTHHVVKYLDPQTAAKRRKLDRRLDLMGLYFAYGRDVDDAWKVAIGEARSQN
jgi:hypothetical protein